MGNKPSSGPPKDAIVAWTSDTLPSEERDAFWDRVDEFENAPLMTDFQRLVDAGVELPDPDGIDDNVLPGKLQEVIRGLAELSVFLDWTDHLSDRELYEKLWRLILREEHEVLSGGWNSFVDVLGDGTDESMDLYLRYYASEQDRQYWRAKFPSMPMPAHQQAPYDRDRHLPRP